MFTDWQLFRRRALGMTLIALALVFVIWNIPALNGVLYPFRLFVTFVHEAGHGLAAILTGGQFEHFEVMANGAGLATTRGGSRAVILPAGYMGAALFGTLMFVLVNRIPYPRLLAFGLGLAIITLAGIYGQTSRLALIVGGAFAGGLLLMSLVGTRYLNVLVLNVLAILTALNAVLDLLFLTQNVTARTPDGRVLNDAAAFSQEIAPGVSPSVWAWAWAVTALMILGLAAYWSVLRPLIHDAILVRRRRAELVRQLDADMRYAEGED